MWSRRKNEVINKSRENTFKIKATEVIKYSDSPYRGQVATAGTDMIFSANLPFAHGNDTYSLKLSDSIESAMDGANKYDPNALLFYQGIYNPILTLKDYDETYLTECFGRLMNGAKLNGPMGVDENGFLYGSLIDRYGICWNLCSGLGEEECNFVISSEKQHIV